MVIAKPIPNSSHDCLIPCDNLHSLVTLSTQIFEAIKFAWTARALAIKQSGKRKLENGNWRLEAGKYENTGIRKTGESQQQNTMLQNLFLLQKHNEDFISGKQLRMEK